MPRKTNSDKNSEKIIVTAALPYANGSIHIGHLLEYIQADIFSRFLKLTGKDALYICASDMHGTPVEVNAQKAGKEPEKFALEYWKEHQEDFMRFFILFDNYYKTHSPENRELAEYFFAELKKKKYIYRKKIRVIYCPYCARSLPDRFVRGTCPLCSAVEQYGDVCENCGNALKGVDLINPKCSLCGRTPNQKESEHYFFRLSAFADKLKKWMKSPDSGLQPEVLHWLNGWMEKGLEDWCISRDGPYFGFVIPDSEKECGEKKYFYVWLDAPIGYISSTKNYCESGKSGKCNWKDYWHKGQVYHLIGKDISYFHFLFWPALLMAVNIPVPKLTVHGFITVNGEKMSKSRGTFFTAKDFLKLYPAEALRFYYASHLDRSVVDVDLNFEDFKAVTNNVLMGNLGNFCYRVLSFAAKNYGKVGMIAVEKEHEKEILKLIDLVKRHYEQQDFKSAVKTVLQISDQGNSYFQQAEVWKNKDSKEAKAAVGWCVNLVRNLAMVVSPILPEFSMKLQTAFGEKKWSWGSVDFSWKGKIVQPEMVVQKIEKVPSQAVFPLQLTVGKILDVKDHPNADSLYVLSVDLGEKGKRQVVAGLKKYLPAKSLLNKTVVFCANMKPAKIRGELSEAMILVADDGQNVGLLEVQKTPIGKEACFTGMENCKKEVTFEEFKKLQMLVRGCRVMFDGKKLASVNEDVVVRDVVDGAPVR
ncbi:methionine--tRNA ligase [Candidatus Woesearchaeota archaeon]|nr:methionine--tRNA ligase [Candidatus Woesearchaeota archaeon]